MSDVRTLHSYARSVLKRRGVKVYPGLSEVIRSDALAILGQDVDFARVFQRREDDNPLIEFYSKRKRYYDDHYGFCSIVYAAVRKFEENPDSIPTYDLVLVDEFQDFNKLEVSLIDLLASKSPVLIAGDDDQALYEFKHASAEFLRSRFDASSDEYESFTLPYCSRCPEVVIDAANDLIGNAKAKGHLSDRISKSYKYFACKAKDDVGRNYPRIVHAQRHSNQISSFVLQQLSKVAAVEKAQFSCLVIAPSQEIRRRVSDALLAKGLRSCERFEKRTDEDVQLWRALKLLLKDKDSNLGWRLAAERVLGTSQFNKALMASDGLDCGPFKDLLDVTTRKMIKSLRATCRSIRDKGEAKPDSLTHLQDALKVDPSTLKLNHISRELHKGAAHLNVQGLAKIPIRVTTIPGSKGLDADFVFLVHFDDRFFLTKNRVTDQDICNFLVCMTRARKRLFLVSVNRSASPTFLDWMDQDRIERV